MGRSRPARALLEDVVQIIARDIKEIESKETNVDADMAGRLVKYVDALRKVVQDEEARFESEREAVARLTDEELAALAKQLTEKKS